ncbi:hypothetical protein Pelo_3146 [Pelomyxa schiedti]|nr:hypothetical protein Pelo_3146 [Pelomyxa schiedti]
MNLQCSPAKPKVSAYEDDICTAWRNLKDLDTGAALNLRKTEVLAVSPPLAKDKISIAYPAQTVTKYKYRGVYIGHTTTKERIEPMINKACKRAQTIIPKVIGHQYLHPLHPPMPTPTNKYKDSWRCVF